MSKLDKNKTNSLDWTEFKKYLKTEEYAKQTFLDLKHQLVDKNHNEIKINGKESSKKEGKNGKINSGK